MDRTHAVDLSDFSIVVLTFNRPADLFKTVASLEFVAAKGGEVIVVDNGSDPSLQDRLESICTGITVITLPTNIGVGARNFGLRRVATEYAITLDDDVRGIEASDMKSIRQKFIEEPDVAAICFRVVSEDETAKVINWCHHRKVEEYSDREFTTDEITEGAVAFRMSTLRQTNLYPEHFFISHEGPALAIQIMNCGCRVIYLPTVTVKHSVAQSGRPSWRRYYFDTRNVVWLSLGYLPFWPGLTTMLFGVGGQLVYSLRDGFFRYWAKAVYDAIRGAPSQLRRRERPTEGTKQLLKALRRERPGVLYMLNHRLFQRGVQI